MAASTGPNKMLEVEATPSAPVPVVFTTPEAYAEHLAATRSHRITEIADMSNGGCPAVTLSRSTSKESVASGVGIARASPHNATVGMIEHKTVTVEDQAFANRVTGFRIRSSLSNDTVSTVCVNPKVDKDGPGEVSPSSISLRSTVAKSADSGSESVASAAGSAQNSQVSSPPQRHPWDNPEHHEHVKNKLLSALGKLEDAVDEMVNRSFGGGAQQKLEQAETSMVTQESVPTAESKLCTPVSTMEVAEVQTVDADDQQKVRIDCSEPDVVEQRDGVSEGDPRCFMRRMESCPRTVSFLTEVSSSPQLPSSEVLQAASLRNALGPRVVRQATPAAVRYRSSPTVPVIYKGSLAVGTSRIPQSCPIIHEAPATGWRRNTAATETPPAVMRRASQPAMLDADVGHAPGLDTPSNLSSLFGSGY